MIEQLMIEPSFSTTTMIPLRRSNRHKSNTPTPAPAHPPSLADRCKMTAADYSLLEKMLETAPTPASPPRPKIEEYQLTEEQYKLLAVAIGDDTNETVSDEIGEITGVPSSGPSDAESSLCSAPDSPRPSRQVILHRIHTALNS